jgi:hypothetical protein
LIACDTSSLQTHPANTLRENMLVFNWIILPDSALERIIILIKLK